MSDLFGYIIELGFRTNAADSNLLLQNEIKSLDMLAREDSMINNIHPLSKLIVTLVKIFMMNFATFRHRTTIILPYGNVKPLVRLRIQIIPCPFISAE